ncbi:MAG: hypothetical protein ACR2GA_06465 [Chloroflexota bacterium]
MRRDRDTILLLLTIVPTVFALWMFLSVQATGVTPFPLPAATIPQLHLPALMQQYITMPTMIQDLYSRFAHRWTMIVPGLVIGLAIGLFFIGGMVDTARAAIRALRSHWPHNAAPEPVDDSFNELTTSL